MNQLPQVLESKMKVRFHDCDPFNHLNNSRYIDYIMTARGDQLIDHYGLDIYQLAKEQDIGWVTAQTQISYLSPALLMEDVIIQTRLIEFSDKSLQFEALMWNHNKTSVKAVMWAKLVHYHLRHQRSHLHQQSLMDLFREVLDPLPVKVNFEERISSLKTEVLKKRQ